MRLLTLTFLVREKEICLALKKRGFGKGYWNGFGGKVGQEETEEQAAIRETKEESWVDVAKEELEQVAELHFHFKNGDHLRVKAFFVRRWLGEPQETEEMKPQWFAYDKIPYEEMWEDDQHWLPQVLTGEKLRGKVWFDDTGRKIERMEWERVDGFTAK